MNKLTFAHQLRGVAALLVVISHLVGVFWAARQVVANISHAPVLDAHIPPMVAIAFKPYYQPGPLGVALFFLISGFVISFSIHKASRGSFLIGRLFRIYPTYVACSLASMATVYLSAQYWSTPYQFDSGKLISNLLLIHNYLGFSSIDLVNWSLAIEIKFYLLMALISPLIVKQRIYPLVIISLATLALHYYHTPLIYFFSHEPTNSILRAFTTEMLYIAYMLIGVLFYYHYSGRLSTAGLMVTLAVMVIINTLTWRHGMLAKQFPVVSWNYAYALVIFGVAYGLRNYFRPQWLLDHLADISYPLYIIHSLMGYCLLNVLMDWQLSYEQALTITLSVVLIAAYGLHRAVELPSNRLGKRLGRGVSGALGTQPNGVG